MTEWAHTIAIQEYECPKCKAKKGECCRLPSGRKTHTPHIVRIAQMLDKDSDRCKGKTE